VRNNQPPHSVNEGPPKAFEFHERIEGDTTMMVRMGMRESPKNGRKHAKTDQEPARHGTFSSSINTKNKRH
jgi:hypothetical protein